MANLLTQAVFCFFLPPFRSRASFLLAEQKLGRATVRTFFVANTCHRMLPAEIVGRVKAKDQEIAAIPVLPTSKRISIVILYFLRNNH
jgi:hypothetical protein